VNEQKKTAPARGASAANRQAQSQAGGDFVRGVFTELRRVTWPTRNEWVSATILTLALVVGIGIYTYVLDYGFGKILDALHLHSI
jgi:preprotein translocase subunit SecE